MERLEISEQIKHRVMESEITYPQNILGAGYYHYRYRPVYGALYSYRLALGDIPVVEDCAEYLLDRYQMEPLRKGTPDEIAGVLTRTHKLVLDFFQRLHLLALIEKVFGPHIAHETIENKGFIVDFVLEIGPFTPGLQYTKTTQLGICTAMLDKYQWKAVGPDWQDRKMCKRKSLGYASWEGMIFSINNRRIQPGEVVNGLPLYGEDHISNMLSEIQEHFAPHQFTML